MKIAAFGMMNNPEYREEPWRESIAQRLLCFDAVCLVCGHEPDLAMLAEAFPEEWKNGKLKAVYKPWSFPEWSYEELPKHLNAALVLAREGGCDWVIKLDIDTFLHEKDITKLHRALRSADRKGKWVVSISKLQFFTPFRYFRKAHLPIVLKASAPIAYGFAENKYTDLCQPIVWDGRQTVVYEGKNYDIPAGPLITDTSIFKSRRARVFNYDFTFRTYDRSVELLYQIEMAHARFWGKGYTGLLIDTITRDSSMNDFLMLSKGRYMRMQRKATIQQHPRCIQQALQGLHEGRWGFDLWNKV